MRVVSAAVFSSLLSLSAQVESHAQHRASRVDEDVALTDRRGVVHVRPDALLRGVVQYVEHVQAQFDTREVVDAERFEMRMSSSVCDESRSVPRGSRSTGRAGSIGLMRAVFAHGLPLRCWRLAATTTPVRGTSIDVMTRSMCGRSLGRRPRALVRSLGSCPNVTPGANEAGGEPTVRPARRQRSFRSKAAARTPSTGCKTRTPASRRPSSFDRDDQAVVGQRVVCGIREKKAAGLRRAVSFHTWTYTAVGQLGRLTCDSRRRLPPTRRSRGRSCGRRRRRRERTTHLAIHANRVLIGVGRGARDRVQRLTRIAHEPTPEGYLAIVFLVRPG